MRFRLNNVCVQSKLFKLNIFWFACVWVFVIGSDRIESVPEIDWSDSDRREKEKNTVKTLTNTKYLLILFQKCTGCYDFFRWLLLSHSFNMCWRFWYIFSSVHSNRDQCVWVCVCVIRFTVLFSFISRVAPFISHSMKLHCACSEPAKKSRLISHVGCGLSDCVYTLFFADFYWPKIKCIQSINMLGSLKCKWTKMSNKRMQQQQQRQQQNWIQIVSVSFGLLARYIEIVMEMSSYYSECNKGAFCYWFGSEECINAQ